MYKTLIGRKVGMTRLYEESGRQVPVTIIEAGPCFVSQIKTQATDGYDAIQIAFGDVKPRNSTMQLIGHDGKAGLSPKRVHREVRTTAEEASQFQVGQELTIDHLADVKFVDVIGRSKGKGFQGVMKRHGFKGQPASHGCERKHRSGGSQSGLATNRGYSGRPKKGKRMPGHMGDVQVTTRSLDIVGRDKEKNLLLVKGPVPGSNGGIVLVRESIRLYKSKAEKAKAS
jgi:large subunit ribosomal protein L3